MPRRLSPEEKQEMVLKDVSGKLLIETVDPVRRLTLRCLQKYGTKAILKLGAAIHKASAAEGLKTNSDVLQRAMKDIALPVDDKEVKEVMEKLEPEDSDPLTSAQLIAAFRPTISAYRRRMIEAAFMKMDTTGTDVIDDIDLRNRYNVNNHMDFLNGNLSREDIVNKFLQNFKGNTITPGKISLEEFVDYYSGICVLMDDDRYFDLLMRNVYSL